MNQEIPINNHQPLEPQVGLQPSSAPSVPLSQTESAGQQRLEVHAQSQSQIQSENQSQNQGFVESQTAGVAGLSFFGAPPLVIGEDPELYYGLREQVFAENKPQSVLDQILVNHMVDKAWELQRHKRYAAHAVNAAAHNALIEVLHPLIPGDADEIEHGRVKEMAHSRKLASGWIAKEPDAVREVDKRLADAGLNLETVMAFGHMKVQPVVDYFDSKAANCLETLRNLQDDFAGLRAVSGLQARRPAMRLENPAYQVIEHQALADEGEGVDDEPAENPR
jgi:hypothetical protein